MKTFQYYRNYYDLGEEWTSRIDQISRVRVAGPALISVKMIIFVMITMNVIIIFIMIMITQGKVSQTSAFISQLQNYDHDHDGPYGKLEMINHRDLYDNHPHGFKTGELSGSSRLFSSLRSSKTRQSRGKVVTQGLLQVVR